MIIHLMKWNVCKGNNYIQDESAILGDGVVTGYGKIMALMFLFCSQTSQFTEDLREEYVDIAYMAMKNKIPVIGLNDSGGARIQEGVPLRWIC